MKSVKNVKKKRVGAPGPRDLIADDDLPKPPHSSLSPPDKMALQKKRLYEQELEGSTVKKKCLSLVSDGVMKDPTVQNMNLKLKLDHQNKKQKVKKPDRRHHPAQSRQERAPDDDSAHSKLSPSPRAHNERSASTIDMTNTHHQQRDTIANRVCVSPTKESSKVPVVRLFRLNIQTENQEKVSTNACDTERHHEQERAPDDDSAHSKLSPSPRAHNERSASTIDMTNAHQQQRDTIANRVCLSPTKESSKVPVVRLFRLNIQTETQEEESTNACDTERHHEQERAPDDDSVHSKLSPSPLAHNELLASTIDMTNTHHQQRDTIANRVCLSPTKESSKVPVVRLFRLNIQTETQEEESTNACDTERHHEQVHQKTDHQESPRGSKTCTSLEDICRGKQPVVKLCRLEKQLVQKELSQLDSEQDSAHGVASPSNSEAHDGMDLPRTPDQQEEAKNEQRATAEGDSEYHRDHVQHVQPEDQEEDSMDDSDSDEFEQALEMFSAYEVERLKNIKQNAKFLKSLRLLEIASTLGQQHKSMPRVRREKPQSDIGIRRSRRLQDIEPLIQILEEKRVVKVERPVIPSGPVEMVPLNKVDDTAWNTFKDTWKSISTGKIATPLKFKCRKLTSYENSLKLLTLEKRAVTRILPGYVCSIAVHPSNTRTLVAAGDHYGNVGLWDLKHQSAGVYLFPLHASKTNSVAFSPSNPKHLLTLGREGTIRCGDISHSVFDEIYNEEGRLTSFDFLSASGSVLLVSHLDSKLSVVDCRTPTNTYDVRGCLNLKFAHTVSVHPLNRDLCVVAGLCKAHIYDVRMLNMKMTEPVLNLRRFTSAVLSASFSPATGKYILTSSLNRLLRVYRIEDFKKNPSPVTSIKFHKQLNKGNMYLAPAAWDPKQENCFGHSFMGVEQIDFCHVKGQCVHTLSSTSLSTRPSALAIHPSRNLVVAGTFGGELCVWKKWKNKADPPEEN